jgi:hypothetical protein
MKLSSNPIVVTGVANSVIIPVDTRMNPTNVFGSVIDGGVSTYSIQYTTSDVYAPGYTAASDPMFAGAGNSIPNGPTTGSKPFSINGTGVTAIRLSVTVGPATVTLGPVFQADNTLGA